MYHLPNFGNPLLWALLVGWIMTVVLHEFAHGIVAYWGGDYTIRERGGLTLNPLQYIDPFMSLLLPLLFMAMGGIALPGGATYVRRDLLRSRGWDMAVSAAGPAMNLLIFLALALAMSPWVGWFNWAVAVPYWTNAQVFVAALAFSQLLAVILNLVPMPPLDGYGIIRPYLPPHITQRLSASQVQMFCLLVYFLLLRVPQIGGRVFDLILTIMAQAGVRDPIACYQAFASCLR